MRGLTALSILLFFLIFARSGQAQELRAEKIYHWTFRHIDDRNSDQWPDGWQRRKDRRHPAYIAVEIVPRDEAVATEVIAATKTMVRILHAVETGTWNPDYIPETTPAHLADFLDRTVLDNCVELRMDGGEAEIISPVFPMDPRFSYRLQADVSSIRLFGHEATMDLVLLDDKQQPLHTLHSPHVIGNSNWEKLSTIDDSPMLANLSFGRIHIRTVHVNSRHIGGVARFDNVSVYRMPRLALSTKQEHNVASPGEPVEINCVAMGISSREGAVRFELHDVYGNLVDSQAAVLDTRSTASLSRQYFVTDKKQRPHFVTEASLSDAFDGQAKWNLKISEPGLYKVSVDLGETSRAARRTLQLAVIDESQPIQAGPFGWSLPEFNSNLTPTEVPRLVSRFGAGWVKYPIWFDMFDTDSADELVKLTERLQAQKVRCVGRIDNPPEAQRASFASTGGELHAVSMFRDPEEWEPLLEPVLTRMGMRLVWFQIGRDNDMSFMSSADVVPRLNEIRARMQNYVQELKLCVNWDWLENDPPTADAVPWSSIAFRARPQLTAPELGAYMEAASDNAAQTWVNIDPLPADRYTLLDRVRDLTERMIEVRRAEVKAAFLSNPFDPDMGLFTHDKKAMEMLIPWHRMVGSIGTSTYVGSIELPAGSTNHVFANGHTGVMILWNDQEVDEQVFLGHDVSASDIWGKPIKVETVAGPRNMPEQKFHVGKWPLIVRGVNVDVVRWRQRFRLMVSNLASRLGGDPTLPVIMENPFEQSVSGQLTLAGETLLAESGAVARIQIATGRQLRRKIPIALRGDASAGKHRLRFDFELDARDKYEFSVYRDVTLGLGDVQINWETVRKNKSQVLLRIELVNHTNEPVGFDCKLFPPGLPYQRFQLIGADPGTTLKEVTLNIPETAEPQENWIRCEGIGSGRVLNYRVEF